MTWHSLSQINRYSSLKTPIFYVIVIGSVVVATLLRLLLISFVGSSSPFITFFPVVIICSWLLGFRGGAAATLLSVLTVDAMFVKGILEIPTHVQSQISTNILYVFEGLAIAGLGQTQLRAHRNAEERAHRAGALVNIGKSIREMWDLQEIQNVALKHLAGALDIDRCLVILLDKKNDLVEFTAEWHKEGLTDLVGKYSLADFDVDLNEIFPATSPLIVPDIYDCPQFSHKSSEMLANLQITSLLDVPMSSGNEIVSVLGVYTCGRTRHWTTDDVSLVEAVASQLRAATESQRVLADARKQADQEVLINRINDSIRTICNPELIQKSVATLVGKALDADRCYFAIYDLEQGEVTIGQDWHKPSLKSVAGSYQFVNTREMFKELYPSTTTSVIRDRDTAGLSEQTVENMKGLQLRARVSAAVADSKGMATLTAAMADTARDWTADDVLLIEKVGAHLRAGLEMARVRQREHRIATDLQAALLPPISQAIPRVQIATTMMPALDEAEIGGDFFDVFSVDKEQYALVIGDVSGKGLKAAAQLAVVRNSLRTLIYLSHSPARAAETINAIMTVHGLLNGFVTLFVGVYDTGTGRLNYTSCGHEPGMVKRTSDGTVEMLVSAGIPLGVLENADYIESSITLNRGDTLLLYTDGISESGASRLEMLGSQGLMRVFESVPDTEKAESMLSTIVDKAQRNARSSFRDDVCILLLQRQRSGVQI